MQCNGPLTFLNFLNVPHSIWPAVHKVAAASDELSGSSMIKALSNEIGPNQEFI
jgi:hypothetical protein